MVQWGSSILPQGSAEMNPLPNMELEMKRTLIKAVSRIVTAQAGQGCRCKFPLEDEYGKYEGYESHDNWELWHQDHDNSNFEYFLKCTGCGYELAKQYWNDLDGTFVDYTDGTADGFWKCPTVDSRKFPSYVQADDDKTTCENCDQEVDKGDTKLFNGHEFCNRCFEDFTPDREELEEQHGQVWNTKELQQDFTVQGFASPCVVVIRKSDGVKGTLEFIHQPRFYFDFVEAG